MPEPTSPTGSENESIDLKALVIAPKPTPPSGDADTVPEPTTPDVDPHVHLQNLIEPFMYGERFYMPLPFSHEKELIAYKDLLNPPSYRTNPLLRKMRRASQMVAEYSHFAFRVYFWDNDVITPPDLREELHAIRSREDTAAFVTEKIAALEEML